MPADNGTLFALGASAAMVIFSGARGQRGSAAGRVYIEPLSFVVIAKFEGGHVYGTGRQRFTMRAMTPWDGSTLPTRQEVLRAWFDRLQNIFRRRESWDMLSDSQRDRRAGDWVTGRAHKLFAGRGIPYEEVKPLPISTWDVELVEARVRRKLGGRKKISIRDETFPIDALDRYRGGP